MQTLQRLALLFACALPAIAQLPVTCGSQTIPICGPGGGSGAVQIMPQAVPNSAAGVVAPSDAYLKIVTVSNTTGGSLNFTLADRQSSPIALLKTVAIAANTTQTFSFPTPYWCPGGFTVLASSTGLVFYAAWLQ